MKELLASLLKGRNPLILGFGKEGQSTLRYLQREFPGMSIRVADRNPELIRQLPADLLLTGVDLFLGERYLDSIGEHALVIKSPGVPLPLDFPTREGVIVTSQTRLMLEAYHRQIIGITGTKGKSTTSSLIRHLLVESGFPCILVGNIGRPPLDDLDEITPETKIVFEMSSHQLEDTGVAPRISVLLNLFPEHLDSYPSLDAYYSAKMRILTGQLDHDIFIFNEDIPEINRRINSAGLKRKYFTFSSATKVSNGCFLSGSDVYVSHRGLSRFFMTLGEDMALKGQHNRMNMMAAILAARNAGADDDRIRSGLSSFQGLEHRLEYVGQFGGIRFFNDSIATIPEATIAAIRALPDTDTLILGGHDRGLDYGYLVDFLGDSNVRNFIFLGKAGLRMLDIFKHKGFNQKNLIMAGSLSEAFSHIPRVTQPGRICLLSPAAASYDHFRNFEERGQIYKKLARSL